MNSEPDGKTRLVLPESYLVDQAEQEKEERISARRERLARERAIVLLQAIEIAVHLQQTVYLVHCSPCSRGESVPLVLGGRTPHYAIRLDNNMHLRREAIYPDGTVKECEEYC